MLWVAAASDYDVIDLITYWAIIMLSTQIPITICHYIMVRKHLQITFELSMILKYFAISLVVFGLIYYLTEQFLEYDSNVFVFIPAVLLFTMIGVFGYISITYLVDGRTKQLVSEIINELKGRF